ncbi:YopX family protein [Capnocytophaga sp. oral taxon 338]|uniref:YopX family protein n=1 Tax=Capnocytophaga sp. oral taxon 338 TaxID=710239 RepID=UPI000202D1AF|nr:YopX family protein [Capnocytophaga sp. oral taxon 338]EGD33314.1 phage protein [Capnocytophaga sp. oral taxon 338 str. F0234]
MRTIKFRGFSEKANIFVYGDLLTFENCFGISETKGERNFYIVETNSIGQFTGLYDKNGKEIYEGDIVEKAVNNIISSHRFKIVYSECFAGFCRLYIKKKGTRDGLISLSEMDVDREEIKVIGNIYDNPELFKQ